MRATIDGKMVEFPEGSTYADMKRVAGIPAGDSLVTIGGRSSEFRNDADLAAPGSYRSLPPTTQG